VSTQLEIAVPFLDLKRQYEEIRDEVGEAIGRVLDSGQYVLGDEVAAFEREFAAYCGSRHAIAVNSGTSALHLALLAAGVGPGDEVITVPMTFVATVAAIDYIGARAVLVDVDPATYTMDAARLEAAITPRTRAIMPVSLYGQCADFAAINAVAARHRLPVIDDAAQSFGATQDGRRSCSLSLIGSTSFFPSKPLGAYGDGGALFTDDDALAKLMREIRVHGQDRRYNHPRLGINGRLDTLQAAVLLAKLEVFDEEVAARGRVGARYGELIREAFAGHEERVLTPWLAPGNTSVYAQYTIEVDERDAVESRMKARGIPTAVHYPMPLHLQPLFESMGLRKGAFPHSERASRRVISLPMHPYLGEEQQRAVVAALRAAVLG